MDMVPEVMPLPGGGGSNTGNILRLGPRLRPPGPEAGGVVEAEGGEDVDFSPTNTMGGVVEATAGESLLASLSNWGFRGWLETRCRGRAVDEVDKGGGVVDNELVVDLMMTVLGPEGEVMVTLEAADMASVVLTGDTRTRRTLPSAETLTSLTGTILAPGGMCDGLGEATEATEADILPLCPFKRIGGGAGGGVFEASTTGFKVTETSQLFEVCWGCCVTASEAVIEAVVAELVGMF